MNIAELRKQKGELVTRARELYEGAEKEGRGLSAEEKANYDQIVTEARGLSERISNAETISELGGVETRNGVVTPQIDPVEIATNPNVYGTQEYRSVFNRWLAAGFAGMSPVEQRALSTTDANGGYLMAPTQVANDLIVAINNRVFIRQLATKFSIENDAKTLGVPTIATDVADGDWTTEVASITEDTALAFGRRDLTPTMLTKLIKVSNKLLRGVPNVEQVVIERLAYKFSVALEKSSMTGNGTNSYLGIFVADANGIPASSDVTAASATTVVIDDFVKTKYALPSQYWAKASWVMHPDTAFKLASQREGSGTGQYLWRESVRVGEPDTLLGVPVYTSVYAPNTFTTGLYTAIIGDFSYYGVADSLSFGVQRLNELYAVNSQTGFIGRLETDAAPMLGDAFRRVKLA